MKVHIEKHMDNQAMNRQTTSTPFGNHPSTETAASTSAKQAKVKNTCMPNGEETPKTKNTSVWLDVAKKKIIVMICMNVPPKHNMKKTKVAEMWAQQKEVYTARKLAAN